MNMIKKLPVQLALLSLTMGMYFCTPTDEPVDLQAPDILPVSGMDAISPSPGASFSSNSPGMNVVFKVADPQGIQEILLDVHGGFDGHSHGRILGDFERLNVRRIFSSTASDPKLRIEQGATEVSIDSYRLAWEGGDSDVQGNVLAGPYHLTISATDVQGNQTGFADGSNYHTTFYIERPYAPLLEVPASIEATAGSPLELSGQILRTTHAISTDIKFVWLRLLNRESLDDAEEDDQIRVFGELKAGQSSWRNLSGNSIPSGETFDLTSWLQQNPIQIPNGQANLVVVVWCEDMAGNVSRKAIPVKVN